MRRQWNFSIILYCFIFLSLLMIQIKLGEKVNLPISFAYVYSESMEPTINTNDGYILVRAKEYKINDIITFKPKVLNENLVTHRIVDETKSGFITKGDHNSTTDQEAGEHLITKEQIIGKVYNINDIPLIIPKLGITSAFFSKLNVFTLISIFMFIYVFSIIFEKYIFKKRKKEIHKTRLIDIAPYFDAIFFLFVLLLFINAFFIVFTVSEWKPVDISYVVVTTEGISSPLPGEHFTVEKEMDNKTPVAFKVIFESKKSSVNINPHNLILEPQKTVNYNIDIIAPEQIGLYNEQVFKYIYLDLLPDSIFDKLYSTNKILPLLALATPGLIVNTLLYIWWIKRWQIGKRKVMEFLIPYRPAIRG